MKTLHYHPRLEDELTYGAEVTAENSVAIGRESNYNGSIFTFEKPVSYKFLCYTCIEEMFDDGELFIDGFSFALDMWNTLNSDPKCYSTRLVNKRILTLMSELEACRRVLAERSR
jgi:hypothetical protein